MQIFEHRDGGRIKIGSGSGLTQYILSLMYGTVHAWRYKGHNHTQHDGIKI